MVHPKRDLASSRAQDVAVDLDQLRTALKEHIKSAQSRYQLSADMCRTPAPEFVIGSLAFIKAQFFRTTWPSKKLAEKYLGPVEIIGQAGTQAYILRLPDSLWAVHLVSMSRCLNPQHRIPSQIGFSLHRLQSKSTARPSTRFPRSLIQRSTGAGSHVTSYTLSVGLVMKVPTRRRYGSSRPNSAILLNS
jgi:hypothetical protein